MILKFSVSKTPGCQPPGCLLGLGPDKSASVSPTALPASRTPYSPNSLRPITRYNNQASIEGRWSPGGGRLMALLRYTNMVDIFADDYDYANSLTHSLMLDGSWKWLPKTALFVNVQQSYVAYINDATTKPDMFPLRIAAGLRGLLTDKTSAICRLGYNNAFLSSGESTGGFWGSTFAELAATIRPDELSRVVAGFRHDFTSAVISSFTYNETVYLSYVQQIAGRLALDISGRYVHRNYQGVFVDPDPGRTGGQLLPGRRDARLLPA